MSPTNGIPVVVAHKDVAAAAPSVTPEAAAQIVKQVKHYFSDANLNHDKFMRESVSNNSGWIDFKVLARFNRLRQLMGIPVARKQNKGNNRKNQKPAPKVADVDTQYVTLLGETIKSGITEEDPIEVNEDVTAIKRKEVFVPSDSWFSRTVHVKGLPYGIESPDFIEKLFEYFAGHGNVQLVRMRRNPKTGDFKGNLLVEYATAEEAEEVSKKVDAEYLGNKLEFVMLPAYHDEKVANDEFIQEELRKPGETYQSFEDYCISKGRPVPSAAKGKNANALKFAELAPGCLVKFTGVTDDIAFDEIKKAFNTVHRVRFLEYTAGSSEGIVRFAEPVAASFIESHPDGQTVGEVTLSVELVDEEGEKAFVERSKAAVEGKGKPKAKSNKIEFVPGCLIKFTSAAGDVSHEKIKEALKSECDVKFVEYGTEKTDGIIRLADPIAAKIIESHADGLTIDEVKISLEPVDEEGEKAFAERAQAAADNKAKKRGHSDNRRGGHGHGGNKRFRK